MTLKIGLSNFALSRAPQTATQQKLPSGQDNGLHANTVKTPGVCPSVLTLEDTRPAATEAPLKPPAHRTLESPKRYCPEVPDPRGVT